MAQLWQGPKNKNYPKFPGGMSRNNRRQARMYKRSERILQRGVASGNPRAARRALALRRRASRIPIIKTATVGL